MNVFSKRKNFILRTGLLVAVVATASAAGWACTASWGHGSYQSYLSEGSCDTMCGVTIAECLKAKCLAQAGYSYGTGCIYYFSRVGKLCEG
jgi:hypothetical protein